MSGIIKNFIGRIVNMFISRCSGSEKGVGGDVSLAWSGASVDLSEKFSWFLEKGITEGLTVASVIEVATVNLDDHGDDFYLRNNGKSEKIMFGREQFRKMQKKLIDRLSDIPGFDMTDLKNGKLDKTFIVQLDFLIQRLSAI